MIRTTSRAASDRVQMYEGLISEHARLNDIRPDLVRAVVQVESAYNPYARSPKGAAGLMQLMPATAQRFGVKNAFNPEENVRAGVAYLRQLLDRYENNEELALAAYNAGPKAVDKYGEKVPPYAETKNYVFKINGLTAPADRTPREQPHLQGDRDRRRPRGRSVHGQASPPRHVYAPRPLNDNPAKAGSHVLRRIPRSPPYSDRSTPDRSIRSYTGPSASVASSHFDGDDGQAHRGRGHEHQRTAGQPVEHESDNTGRRWRLEGSSR